MGVGLKSFLLAALLLAPRAPAVEPPAIPLGLDAYRSWERWPDQRIGLRACMRSTYDRAGGNEGADASHFLYQLSENQNVTLDVAGAGVLCFARYNHWHGSPWHYTVDGENSTVQESSTADPLHPVSGAVFLPEKSFPSPMAVTWAETKGADLSWIPIGFTNSFRMDYARTHYGTGYYIYQQIADGAKLVSPLAHWDGAAPARDVVNLFSLAGTDLAPTRRMDRASGMIPQLKSGAAALLFATNGHAQVVRKLGFSISHDQAIAFGHARLRITWDDRVKPSIDAPVALFFGAGTLYNRDDRPGFVRAFPVNILYHQTNVDLACYFPMPFFRSAKFELIGPANESITNVQWHLVCGTETESPQEVGYFHATYRDHASPVPGRDLLLLDTRKAEGGGDWSGSFVGTSWIFSDRANLTTLEGDPRFFFDDSQTPQAQGTGTEEWGGGGDYWGGLNMTLPFAGHPTGAAKLSTARNGEDKIESAYRFLLGDLMPFGRRAVIQLEHGGEDQSTEHYQTIAYWYGAPAASLVKTDELKIGDPASETAHDYNSPQASAPYPITSRYEWGVDTLNGREIYPASMDKGRKTTGASEFIVQLTPENYGVLLRRKLDYALPNQRADVFVADGGGGKINWQPAGVWYTAGGNTCVYSNPHGELGLSQHIVQTSNRRFRDDEFLISRKLTRGRKSIRVRVRFVPSNIPLFPGHPLEEQAWSEIRYDAYCFVMPQWQP